MAGLVVEEREGVYGIHRRGRRRRPDAAVGGAGACGSRVQGLRGVDERVQVLPGQQRMARVQSSSMGVEF